MTDCVHFVPLIGSREGELSPEEARALTAHVAGCASCQAWAADLAATEGLVSEALLARAAQRDFGPFVDQVMARVSPAPRAGVLEWLRANRRTAAVWLAPVLAAAALIVYVSVGGGSPQVASLELTAEGEATTVIQTADGPIVLLAPEGNS